MKIFETKTIVVAVVMMVMFGGCETRTTQEEANATTTQNPTTQTTDDTSNGEESTDSDGSTTTTDGTTGTNGDSNDDSTSGGNNGGVTTTTGTGRDTGNDSDDDTSTSTDNENDDDNTVTGGETTTNGDDDKTDTNTSTGGGNDDTTTSGTDDNVTTGGNDDNATTGSNDNNTTTSVDDNTTTTPTVTLSSLNLTIDKTSLNKDDTTPIKVMATYSDNTSKELTDKVEWIVTPSDAIQVSNATLTALKDKATTVKAKVGSTLSNTLNLTIAWVVNGHTLPPEPDKATNDSTLLGIDSNNNGVRDDVERYILQTYGKEKITIEIGFQVARAYNTVIEHPENAWETDKVLSAAQDCASYFSSFAEFFNEPILLDKNIVVSKKFKSIMLNTRERIRNYLFYNQKLSGGIFASTPIDELKAKCSFDADILLKARK